VAAQLAEDRRRGVSAELDTDVEVEAVDSSDQTQLPRLLEVVERLVVSSHLSSADTDQPMVRVDDDVAVLGVALESEASEPRPHGLIVDPELPGVGSATGDRGTGEDWHQHDAGVLANEFGMGGDPLVGTSRC
jgi:hypothetical protein